MNSSKLTQLLKLVKADKVNIQCIIEEHPTDIVATATSPCESVVTSVTLSNSFVISKSIGIRDVEKLIKMLSLHSDEVDLKISKTKLIAENGKVKIEYAIADPAFIPVKKVNHKFKYNGEVNISSPVNGELLRALKVLSDSEQLGIILADEESVVTLGDRSDYSNKISMTIPSKSYVPHSSFEIFFLNLQIVKQIMETNSNCENAVLKISMEGIVQFVFTYENLVAEYNLIMLDNE